MAKLGVVAAAAAVGVSRHTIWRYAKSGKLSVEVAPSGDRVIDTSELVRVFGELQPPATSQQRGAGNGVHHADTTEVVATLQQHVEEQRAEIERLRGEVEGERAERRALQDRYLTIIERLQLTGPTKPVAVSRSRTKKIESAPVPPVSALETLAGSVAGWLSGDRR